MELWSLLALKPSFPSSEVAEEIASSHTQASVSLTPWAGTMKTSSTSLKYYIQNITFNNHQPQNNYANVSLYYITPFPLVN